MTGKALKQADALGRTLPPFDSFRKPVFSLDVFCCIGCCFSFVTVSLKIDPPTPWASLKAESTEPLGAAPGPGARRGAALGPGGRR